jgi:type IV secretion system protein VirB8
MLIPDELEAYFVDAKRWDQDRLDAARTSRNAAWVLAGVASAAAIVSIASTAALAPLKTVEPFVVRVNETTGGVDVMTALKGPEPRSYNEAVSKYFLSAYVRAREGYLPGAAQANFRQVSILSTTDEQERWSVLYRGSNPKSPQVVFGQGAVVDVGVRAISFISPKVASVRFHRTIRRDHEIQESDHIATIAFTYVRAPMLESDRLLNPLGFQVQSYRSDPEAPDGK